MQVVTDRAPRPIVLCDIDDVLCLERPYGGAHARDSLLRPNTAPQDLWDRLFERDAVKALNTLFDEFNPQLVITSSWLSLLDREHFVAVFDKTALPRAAAGLHQHWCAPAHHGESRLAAIDKWLDAHHAGEAVLILDDTASGESLIDSFHQQSGRALLCQPKKGLHSGMLDAARLALRSPYSASEPWKL